MDDVTLPPQPAPVLTPPQAASPANDLSGELAHVTQEMYKKNLELAGKNKTLSLLRKIDEIVLSSVTDAQVVAQQVVDTIVAEASVKAVSIFLLNKKEGVLHRLALSQTEEILRAELEYHKKYLADTIPLSQTENFIAKAASEKAIQNTTTLYHVLLPTFTQAEAQQIQNILGVTNTAIYPLIVRNDLIGVMSVDMGEKDAILSDYQKELIDRLAGVIGIALDNSLLYQNIQMANERLKELDHMKDEFVSLASHELRTPMTAIKSYIWMLLEHKMIQDPKGKEYLQHTYEATDRLINLVNDMLNVSRIESGRMVITLIPVDLRKLITDVIAEVNPAAEKVGVTITSDIQVSLPQVQADANKMKEVFINLIGNAIKFTPQGGKITITGTYERGMVVSRIIDTGNGIDAADIPKLFKKFSMIEKNYNAKPIAQGTGLGLYICKSIVEKHGGTIGVYSEGLGKGTTFGFTLKPVV